MKSCDPRREKLQQLESLVQETAGSARKARRLAERILHELIRMAPAGEAPAVRRCYAHQATDRPDATADSDAESGWRLAA